MTFQIYAFRDRDGAPFARAYVCRNRVRDMEPETRSPGAVERFEIDARHYGEAKQRGFEFAAIVFDAGGMSVRRK
jgi:hypothetical protein